MTEGKGLRPKDKRKNAGKWPCPFVASDDPNTWFDTAAELAMHVAEHHWQKVLELRYQLHPEDFPEGGLVIKPPKVEPEPPVVTVPDPALNPLNAPRPAAEAKKD